MSFSSRIKEEISKIKNEKNCCQMAQIAASVRVAGTNNKLDNGDQLFAECGIVFGETEPILEQYLIGCKRCCGKAYVRGAFLAGGSISDPGKAYHLEIVCKDAMIAEELSEYLEIFNISAKVVERKGHFVLYIQEGENIVDFLNIIGAHKSLMELENVRIFKDVRNNVNRQVNCETANIQKTVDASIRQVESIKFIIKKGALEKLSPQLREAAIVRLENPDTDLYELGQLLNNPIGKSGINHRLRKIDEIAELLRIKKGVF